MARLLRRSFSKVRRARARNAIARGLFGALYRLGLAFSFLVLFDWAFGAPDWAKWAGAFGMASVVGHGLWVSLRALVKGPSDEALAVEFEAGRGDNVFINAVQFGRLPIDQQSPLACRAVELGEVAAATVDPRAGLRPVGRLAAWASAMGLFWALFALLIPATFQQRVQRLLPPASEAVRTAQAAPGQPRRYATETREITRPEAGPTEPTDAPETNRIPAEYRPMIDAYFEAIGQRKR